MLEDHEVKEVLLSVMLIGTALGKVHTLRYLWKQECIAIQGSSRWVLTEKGHRWLDGQQCN